MVRATTTTMEQIQDAKDLHHLSLVGSYGAHLLHGFPPHFLHPTVTSASSASNPFSSSGGAFVKPFPSNLPLPSAFAPPTKCVGLGLEQVTCSKFINSFTQQQQQRQHFFALLFRSVFDSVCVFPLCFSLSIGSTLRWSFSCDFPEPIAWCSEAVEAIAIKIFHHVFHAHLILIRITLRQNQYLHTQTTTTGKNLLILNISIN